MMEFLYTKMLDPQFLLSAAIAIAAAATVLTVAMPLLEGDGLGKRMKSVSSERDRIRERERERLAASKGKASLRQEPKKMMKGLVDRLSLSSWLGTEQARLQLMKAGFRGPQAEITFLFFRLVTPIACFAAGIAYIFFILEWQQSFFMRLAACVGCAYVGIKVPEVFLSNIIQKRQASVTRAFPNSLDLLLICIESGMSIEHAFRKVSTEIGSESVPMAEEFTLATAELSYLPDRRMAFENLGLRTGIEAVRSLTTALVQAERYGTPIGSALRVLAQESRDARMNEAEKKAAALPPKLTVPMILFFLPVLFVVILTPALIQVFHWE